MPTITVQPGVDTLQTAMNNANPGDTLVLTGGGVYTASAGGFVLPPAKSNPSNLYITVQPDAASLSHLPVPGYDTTAADLSTAPATGRVFPSGTPGGPVNVGVGMDQFMPKIYSNGTPANGSFPALITNSGNTSPPASYWQFIGIEFAPATPTTILIFYLIRVCGLTAINAFFSGSSTPAFNGTDSYANTTSTLPHHIHFDRCYIHAWDQQGLMHGMELYAISCNITNCYLANFKSVSGDTWQGASCGSDANAILVTGPGPFNFINNYIEASGQGILIGAGGLSPPTVPVPGAFASGGKTGILLKFNTFTKDIRWCFNDTHYTAPDSNWTQPAHSWLNKNFFEIKNGENVTIDHNIGQFQWDGAANSQNGVGFTTNLNNYSSQYGGGIGAAWEQVQNVTFSNNILDRCMSAFDIASESESGTLGPTQVLQNITISNNLVTNLNWLRGAGSTSPYPGAAPQTYKALRINWGNGPPPSASNIKFDHNTIIQAGLPSAPAGDPNAEAVNSDYLRGFFADETSFGGSQTPRASTTGLVITNNVGPSGHYGFITSYFLFNGDSASDATTEWPGLVMTGNVVFDTPVSASATLTNYWTSLGAANNQNPANQGAVGFTTTALSFPGAGQYGSTLNFTGYQLAGDGCNVSLLPWGVIAGAPTTTTITQPSPVPSGSTAMVTVTVNPQTGSGTPTGTVTLNGIPSPQTNSLPAGSNQVTFSVPGLASGNYTLTAIYNGDSTFASSTSAPVTLTVTGAGTTMLIPAVTVQQGQNATIIVQMTSGTHVTVASNTAVSTSNVVPGGATVTVTVSGSLSASPTGNVTLSVSGGPTSAGPFTIPLSSSGSGQATGSTTLSGLNQGTYTLTANYPGDANFASSSGSTSVAIPAPVMGGGVASFSADEKTVTINYPGTNIDLGVHNFSGTIHRPVVSPWGPTVWTTYTAIWVDAAAPGGGNGSFNNPYNTIAAALAVAGPGNVVYLKPGTYTEATGTGGGSANPGAIPITHGGTDDAHRLILSCASASQVPGGGLGSVTIKPPASFFDSNTIGPGPPGTDDSANPATVMPAIIKFSNGAQYVTINGLIVWGPKGVSAYHITAFENSGILLEDGGSFSRITNNVVIGTTGSAGIKEQGHGNSNVLCEANISLDNGLMSNTHGYGHGIYCPSDFWMINGNVCLYNGGFGIQNYHNQADAAPPLPPVRGPFNNDITRNICFLNGQGGIITNANTSRYYNNTCASNNGNPNSPQGGFLYYQIGCQNNTVRNNINAFNATGRDNTVDDYGKGICPSNNTDDFNLYLAGVSTTCGSSAVTYGSHEIIGQDPLFTNAAGGDFRLQAGSPAIGKGTNVGLSGQGANPDMGAFG